MESKMNSHKTKDIAVENIILNSAVLFMNQKVKPEKKLTYRLRIFGFLNLDFRECRNSMM